MKIFIIDDDRDDLDLYVEVLNDIDRGVHTTFTDARVALDLLHRSRQFPDLILVDVNMPLMNGIEFLEVLRDEPSLKHLWVEGITTSCNNIVQAALSELGSDCYQKPSSFNEFKAMLGGILAKNKDN